jgi:hypothetical protein
MLIVDFYKIPVGLSLGIVALIIASFMFASLWVTRKPRCPTTEGVDEGGRCLLINLGSGAR